VDVMRKAADGTGPVEALLKNGAGGDPQSFAADGRSLVFAQQNGADLLLLAPGTGPAPLLANPGYNERNAVISPDGRWIAYESNEAGTYDIYVRPFPAVDSGRSKISDGGATRPLWSRTGRELFYTSTIENFSQLKMMAVAVQPGPSFVSSKPEALFNMQWYSLSIFASSYDVAPDGRFMLMKSATQDAADGRQRLIVVSNWIEEVKARSSR
jgi:eukaryotic-like serine/threonine-protein kinase